MSIEPKFTATEAEIQIAAEMLAYWLDFAEDPRRGAIMLRKILDELLPGVEQMYAALAYKMDQPYAKVADTRIPKLVVSMLQTELLSQRSIRELLLRKLLEKQPDNPIFFKESGNGGNGDETNDLFTESRYDIEFLVERRWKPGTYWARKLAKALNLPDIFAGIPTPPQPPSIEDIEMPPALPPLEDFQENIKAQILSLICRRDPKENRGIVRLPTGAGKTRIAVEALIEYWRKRNDKTRYLLWIAQTRELCEQAVESFRQVWTTIGEPGQKLRIFRFWGSDARLPNLDEEGVIVAGIDKLYEDTKREGSEGREARSELASLSKYVGCAVVDEAHRSITKMYNSAFRALGIDFHGSMPDQIPLLGLTATPYRGYNDEETEYLLNKYNRKILYPSGEGFDKSWNDWNWIKQELTSRGILSKVIHEQFYTNVSVDVHDDEIREWGEYIMFQKKFFTKLGDDYKRNKIIYDRLVELCNLKNSILFFAPSVRSASIISALLQDNGITSAVITGETGSGIRQMYVRKFKEGKIKVLCNYGVLTTGFDAPRIDGVLIARPTESPNLYEQMIGRGLRGPKFGGTDECLIWDVLDNIYLHTYLKSGIFKDASKTYWDSVDHK